MSSSEKYFGTDGVRGCVNTGAITPGKALLLGQVIATKLSTPADHKPANRPHAVLGKDSRRSGDMLESAITSGLHSVGMDVMLAGVVPTPAISMLVRETGAHLGIVISASHNPPEDNGIKFFGKDGYKLSDEQEMDIGSFMLSGEEFPESSLVGNSQVGQIKALTDSAQRYISMAVSSLTRDAGDCPLTGLKISLDTANGASSFTSPQILEKLGADIVTHFDAPSGDNINVNCGCTHPGVIAAKVKSDGSDVGISHDGDADRILMCDENAEPVDGDELMALIGCHLLEKGRMAANTLVATKMSNLGLDECIAACGGKTERTEIGDRHVVNRMREIGANFGGEQSGHIICRDHNTTGDGILAALAALQVMQETGKPLSELRKVLRKFPSKLINVPVASKPDISTLKAAQLIAQTEKELGETGRVLIRYSGTGPKIRILVEGKDEDLITTQAEKIAEAVIEQIGL
ncbi:MAG: phosphoglucosamine mutase [Verrucomicrobiaceae bacterium]|nr:phosphoglucosamine mutase [Verrucomicrobiaceae bacterium]